MKNIAPIWVCCSAILFFLSGCMQIMGDILFPGSCIECEVKHPNYNDAIWFEEECGGGKADLEEECKAKAYDEDAECYCHYSYFNK